MAIAAICFARKATLPAIRPSILLRLTADDANTPRRTMPSAPPTPWTPQTSSASSHRRRFFNATAKQQTTPAAIPMIGAVVGETYPAAGVIVASPATAPVRRPTKVGRLSSNHPTTSQVIAANEAATSVLRNASAVTE